MEVDCDAAATAAASTVRVTLIDAVPCNLSDSWFLRSRVQATIPRDNLRLFLHCYGFVLYDKEKKLALLRRNTVDSRVREIASVLDECRTLADFKNAIREQLLIVNSILADPATRSAMAAAAAVNGDGGGDGHGHGGGVELQILDVAKRSLEHIFEFIRDSDHLRRCINANEYSSKHMFKKDDERATRAVYDSWHDARDCEFDRCVSVIFRDAIVSTGMQTQSTMLFVVRACLVLTFLVTNFMSPPPPPRRRAYDGGGGIDDTAAAAADVRIEVIEPSGGDRQHSEFWAKFGGGGLTVEKFIATTMVAMTRMFVDSCLNWPVRVRDHSVISVANFRSRLLGKLSSSGGGGGGDRSQRALLWLRAMKSKRSGGGGGGGGGGTVVAGTGGKRLYVRLHALLELFDKMSGMVTTTTTTTTSYGGGGDGYDTVDAAIRTGDTMPAAASQPLCVKLHGSGNTEAGRLLARQWAEYDADSKMCVGVLSEMLNDDASTAVSVERFVVDANSTYRSRDDDVNDRRGEDVDEVELLTTDLAMMFLFSLLSLARYAPPNTKVYHGERGGEGGALGHEEQEEDESSQVLLIHMASHLFRSKITLNQTRELFAYIIDVWRSHVGLVTLEQLSQILFTLYRMFQL